MSTLLVDLGDFVIDASGLDGLSCVGSSAVDVRIALFPDRQTEVP